MISSRSNAPVDVSIFDAKGKEVFSKKVNVALGTRWIPLGSLNAGSYIATVTQGSKQATLKFNK